MPSPMPLAAPVTTATRARSLSWLVTIASVDYRMDQVHGRGNPGRSEQARRARSDLPRSELKNHRHRSGGLHRYGARRTRREIEITQRHAALARVVVGTYGESR
jgi:hypothetical protein